MCRLMYGVLSMFPFRVQRHTVLTVLPPLLLLAVIALVAGAPACGTDALRVMDRNGLNGAVQRLDGDDSAFIRPVSALSPP